MKLASFFTGCGGLDLGFEKAGFNVVWSNDNDSDIWETIVKNYTHTVLDKRSIVDVSPNDIPDVDGFIGGPPCQSWSEAGKGRGANDDRGKLFWEYMRLIEAKQPKFFLAENVSGILSKRHKTTFDNIIKDLENIGYDVYYKLLNAHDYGVAQDRLRVFVIGVRKDLNVKFKYPDPLKNKLYLKDVIYDLRDTVVSSLPKNHANQLKDLNIINHEYFVGDYSSMYMSRNRVRHWDQPSFTIQAGGRHAPIHPDAPQMIKVAENKFVFEKDKEHLYRRLSVRECLRIQDFPDNFILYYNNVSKGYKMVGNAVPVGLAYQIALQLKYIFKDEPTIISREQLVKDLFMESVLES